MTTKEIRPGGGTQADSKAFRGADVSIASPAVGYALDALDRHDLTWFDRGRNRGKAVRVRPTKPAERAWLERLYPGQPVRLVTVRRLGYRILSREYDNGVTDLVFAGVDL